MAIQNNTLSGREKAAILLISLGPDLSAEIMKHMMDEDIDRLTLEIASTRKVDSALANKVSQEFTEMYIAQEYINEGGIDYAKKVLEKAMGSERASDVLSRLTASLQVRPFDYVNKADPGQILDFLQQESPQTIALVLSYLSPGRSAQVLASLDPKLQVEVAKRISSMERTRPEVAAQIEKILERKMANLMEQDYTRTGGIDCMVDILNKVDRQTEKTILSSLDAEIPHLSVEIKKKLFLFEDILYLEGRTIQRILQDVDLSQDLPLALKAASEALKEKFLENLSLRARDILLDSMEYLGPVRIKDVEDAQQKIVSTIRSLEDQGEIVLGRGGGDDLIV